MDKLRGFVSTIEHILDTERKRHIVGGILVSASIFFGALAITVISMNKEDEYNE